MTLVGDCLKGLIAAELGYLFAGDLGLLVGGTCAILGHDFPAVFRFKGGKGIATSLGLIIAVNPWMALILTELVVGVAATLRYMSVGSIAAAVLYPLLDGAVHARKRMLRPLSGLFHLRRGAGDLLPSQEPRAADPRRGEPAGL